MFYLNKISVNFLYAILINKYYIEINYKSYSDYYLITRIYYKYSIYQSYYKLVNYKT